MKYNLSKSNKFLLAIILLFLLGFAGVKIKRYFEIDFCLVAVDIGITNSANVNEPLSLPYYQTCLLQ
jgi:hypothetical protein